MMKAIGFINKLSKEAGIVSRLCRTALLVDVDTI
jgi:hypothetical protein